MLNLKFRYCIAVISSIIFTNCNNAGNNKNVTMLYADRRISFIVLKADCFENYDTVSLKSHENSVQLFNKLREAITKITNPSNSGFIEREKRYDTVFDYTAYADAQLKGLKKRIDSLIIKEEFTEDDIEFLELADIHISCAAYFKDFWYISPEIKFSENFYQHFFKSKEKKLFEHYLYDSDITSEFKLPIAYKYPGKYEYIPSPHVIDKTFASELLGLIKARSNENINDFLKDESKFFEEILEGVVSDKYILIIKTYL